MGADRSTYLYGPDGVLTLAAPVELEPPAEQLQPP